ncbi:hypothetical protein KBC59_01810 [Patescibacteria group bacterium]|nr:hypothetical protein [Patescibacteria group bacterium]
MCGLQVSCILFHEDCSEDPSPCACLTGQELDTCLDGTTGGGAHGAGGQIETGGSGSTGGSGGTSIVTGGSGGDGGTGGSGPCPGQKLCGETCVDLDDPATGCAAESCDPCTYLEPTCTEGVCGGPCGPVPDNDLWACLVYGTSIPTADQHVGLVGGIADPNLGQSITEHFFNPMGGCTNPVAGEPFALCSLGTPPPEANIQFRGALFETPGEASIPGTFDCGTSTCQSKVYIYSNQVEVGWLIENMVDGVVIPYLLEHFDPPNLLNVLVVPPQ